MTTNAAMARLVLLAAASFFPPPAAVAGQKSVCVNGAPQAECSSFLVLEAGGLLPVVQTTRGVSWSGQEPVAQAAFGDRFHWEVGMMKNVSDRWALGGAVNLGDGAGGALTGITARGRRWLTHDLGLDVSGGASFQQSSSGVRQPNPTADVRLNFRDDLYLGVRWEQTVLDRIRETDSTGTVFYDDPGGRQHALSLLLGVGSEWAIGGSAALGAALIAFLLTADFS